MGTNLFGQANRRYFILAGLFSVAPPVFADSPILEFNGHFYQRFDPPIEEPLQALPQEQAQSDCVARGGYLAVLTDDAENSFAWSNFYDDGTETRFWIGGVQEEQPQNQLDPSLGWGWISGESWSFTDWQDGLEPNDSGPPNFTSGVEDNDENCLEMRGKGGDNDGTWNDKSCDGEPDDPEVRYYLCEFDARRTNPPEPVPSTSEWGLVLMAALIAAIGFYASSGRKTGA